MATNVYVQQSPEEWSMIGHLKMQQLVNDHFATERLGLAKECDIKRNAPFS